MGYVYLLCQVDSMGQETFKIGVTKNNPDTRVKQLQTGNPNKITLLNKYQSENYKGIEHWLHRKFNASQTLAKNEWFSLTNENIYGFIKECENADGTIEFLKGNNHFYK